MKSPLINDGKPSIQISRVYKKGPDKIRTETITPDAQVLVENGAWLYTKNPATGQVIKSQRSVKTERLDGISQVGQINDYLKDYEAKLISPAEEALWKRGASNAGYHYLGCAKTFALMGKAFAETLLPHVSK